MKIRTDKETGKKYVLYRGKRYNLSKKLQAMTNKELLAWLVKKVAEKVKAKKKVTKKSTKKSTTKTKVIAETKPRNEAKMLEVKLEDVQYQKAKADVEFRKITNRLETEKALVEQKFNNDLKIAKKKGDDELQLQLENDRKRMQETIQAEQKEAKRQYNEEKKRFIKEKKAIERELKAQTEKLTETKRELETTTTELKQKIRELRDRWYEQRNTERKRLEDSFVDSKKLEDWRTIRKKYYGDIAQRPHSTKEMLVEDIIRFEEKQPEEKREFTKMMDEYVQKGLDEKKLLTVPKGFDVSDEEVKELSDRGINLADLLERVAKPEKKTGIKKATIGDIIDEFDKISKEFTQLMTPEAPAKKITTKGKEEKEEKKEDEKRAPPKAEPAPRIKQLEEEMIPDSILEIENPESTEDEKQHEIKRLEKFLGEYKDIGGKTETYNGFVKKYEILTGKTYGSGKIPKEGLTNTQIDEFMKDNKNYLGTIASDQIVSEIVPKVREKSTGSFIMNLDKSNKPGSHWVAVYFTPRSIEYFDSFANPPDPHVHEQLKHLAHAIRPNDFPLVYKINHVQKQDDDTSTCGYHAMKFIDDRDSGKSFSEATGFSDHMKFRDDSQRGERAVSKYVKHLQSGGQSPTGIESFDYITGAGIIDKAKEFASKAIQRVKDVFAGVRKIAPPVIRKFMEENGDAKITSIIVGRKPIQGIIEKVASWLSGGVWDKNKAKMGYERMMHLFMIITLDNGKKFKLEKNQVVELKMNPEMPTDKITVKPPNVTFNEFIANGTKKAEQAGQNLWVYDAVRANCQYFVKWLLSGSGSWNSDVEKFVMQDAEKVIENLSWFEKVARKVTDIANVADVAKEGKGKKKSKKI